MKLVSMTDLKSVAVRHAGSSPAARTNYLVLTVGIFLLFAGMGIKARLDSGLIDPDQEVENIETRMLLRDDPNWFDPRFKAGAEIMPWQTHPYGKLWHERDLMGRNT